MSSYAIGEVSRRTGFSADTLRYYERIGLLRPVGRNPGGRRRYRKREIEHLEFINRAKQMDFSLDEIAVLLRLRDKPKNMRPQVRSLAENKLKAITLRIDELGVLRNELTLLLSLCADAKAGCPILDSLSELPLDKTPDRETRQTDRDFAADATGSVSKRAAQQQVEFARANSDTLEDLLKLSGI